MPQPDRSLFAELKIMYQTGKCNDLVPFLVPQDTYKALDKLSDPAIRNDCGVSPTNSYLFPRPRKIFQLSPVKLS